MVGQKSLDLGPPPHLSRKYTEIDSLLIFVFMFLSFVNCFQFSEVRFLLKLFLA